MSKMTQTDWRAKDQLAIRDVESTTATLELGWRAVDEESERVAIGAEVSAADCTLIKRLGKGWNLNVYVAVGKHVYTVLLDTGGVSKSDPSVLPRRAHGRLRDARRVSGAFQRRPTSRDLGDPQGPTDG